MILFVLTPLPLKSSSFLSSLAVLVLSSFIPELMCYTSWQKVVCRGGGGVLVAFSSCMSCLPPLRVLGSFTKS